MGRGNYSKSQKEAAWNNATEMWDENPDHKRIDRHGRIIIKTEYNNRNSDFGWNIHHRDECWRNGDRNNLEAVNFDTHEELH